MAAQISPDGPTDLDPGARREAVAIGAGRVLLGLGILAATRQALSGLGFRDPSDATIAVGRIAGGRDIALGLHALAVRNDRSRLREAVAIGALVDSVDAIVFGLGFRGGADARRLALRSAPAGAFAALAGLRTLRRL